MTPPNPHTDPQAQLIALFSADRRLAHRELFRHRHTDLSPEFHGEMIDAWHSGERASFTMAFRGGGKSTLAEEGVVIQACLREFRNCLIVAESLPKAMQRLHAIRRQFERNKVLREVFGGLRGHPWGDDRIELTTGITIVAMGRGQSIRGTKAEDLRPDLILVDDIEDAESMRTAEGTEKIQRWFFGDLMSAGDDPTLRVRGLANDMGIECLGNRLKHPDSGFVVRVYPWEFVNALGEREATWPARFPLAAIDRKRKQFFAAGRSEEYYRDFMCQSRAPEEKAFTAEMVRVQPTVRTWQAVYAMLDPARTVGAASATTGCAIWSWVGPRLVVWDAWAKKMLPSEIVGSLFEIDEVYRPVEIGVERDGLEEWMMQPIRQEQVRRGVMLPVKGLKAPKGKTDFIRGLQAFFSAGEVVFAKEMPELRAQLLNFPTPPIDAPNALAYAQVMRRGTRMYEDFTGGNVADELVPMRGQPLWLCLGADGRVVTACTVQLVDGALRVYGDWMREGTAAEVLKDLLRTVALESGRAVRPVCGPGHFDRWHNHGLVQAANKLGLTLQAGVAPERGRSEIRLQLQRLVKGFPAVMVASAARWTLNGFSGGYTRALERHGALADHAEAGQYRVLLEGLESFAGLMGAGIVEEDGNDRFYKVREDGSRYLALRGH